MHLSISYTLICILLCFDLWRWIRSLFIRDISLRTSQNMVLTLMIWIFWKQIFATILYLSLLSGSWWKGLWLWSNQWGRTLSTHAVETVEKWWGRQGVIDLKPSRIRQCPLYCFNSTCFHVLFLHVGFSFLFLFLHACESWDLIYMLPFPLRAQDRPQHIKITILILQRFKTIKTVTVLAYNATDDQNKSWITESALLGEVDWDPRATARTSTICRGGPHFQGLSSYLTCPWGPPGEA